jgi:protoporphyrinogen oxidase
MQRPEFDRQIVVLGGGPAGLAAAWGLEELRRPYRVLEAAPTHGGNARTIRFGQFLYDTGPHRFHDRDPEATRRVLELLGNDMRTVEAASRIYWNGRFVDFPLRPVQALTSGSISRAARAIVDLLAARLAGGKPADAEDFDSWARLRFGRTVAESFLIPFSEKLWGLPAAELSPDIAGRRLPGFRLLGLLKELVLRQNRHEHLEGRFLYPRNGYGQIVDAMAQRLSPGRLQCGNRVTRVWTAGGRIAAVDCRSRGTLETLPTDAVVNTLPITLLVQMMDPSPPADVLAAAARLRFRDVLLVALFLDQESVSDAACTYFSDPRVSFSRAHEPRNRSREMAPPGKTSLVVEFPCFERDPIWTQDEGVLVDDLVRELARIGLIERGKVEASHVTRLRKAYPVYSKDYGRLSGIVLSYLASFENLQTIGRGGSFFYGHVHDFVSAGFAAANAIHSHLSADSIETRVSA